MVGDLEGVRIPLIDHGSAEGEPTSNRLLLTAKAPDVGSNELTFALDSGASTVVLFRNTHTGAWLLRREDPGAPRSSNSLQASGLQAGARAIYLRGLQTLTLGRRVLANLAAAAPRRPQRRIQMGCCLRAFFRASTSVTPAGSLSSIPSLEGRRLRSKKESHHEIHQSQSGAYETSVRSAEL